MGKDEAFALRLVGLQLVEQDLQRFQLGTRGRPPVLPKSCLEPSQLLRWGVVERAACRVEGVNVLQAPRQLDGHLAFNRVALVVELGQVLTRYGLRYQIHTGHVVEVVDKHGHG